MGRIILAAIMTLLAVGARAQERSPLPPQPPGPTLIPAPTPPPPPAANCCPSKSQVLCQGEVPAIAVYRYLDAAPIVIPEEL